jgi:hypothetical protein
MTPEIKMGAYLSHMESKLRHALIIFTSLAHLMRIIMPIQGINSLTKWDSLPNQIVSIQQKPL